MSLRLASLDHDSLPNWTLRWESRGGHSLQVEEADLPLCRLFDYLRGTQGAGRCRLLKTGGEGTNGYYSCQYRMRRSKINNGESSVAASADCECPSPKRSKSVCQRCARSGWCKGKGCSS